jgi:Domain of unknown function (DUF4124)
MKKTCLLLLALLFAVPAAADVYKWKDEKGVTHYGDDPRAAGKGAATIKSAPSGADADAAAAAALIPKGNVGAELGQAYDFNGLPVATIAMCLVYARQAANADPGFSYLGLHGPGNPDALKHRIEATCPGVVFHCGTFINREKENYCQPDHLRKGQEPVMFHNVRMCDASCPKH